MPTPQPLNSVDEYRKAIDSEKPTFIEFWATWCGPCRYISPIYDSLAGNHSDTEVFYKVDIDDQPVIAAEADIRALPVFIVYQNGNELERVVGANAPALVTMVEKYASGTPDVKFSTLPAK